MSRLALLAVATAAIAWSGAPTPAARLVGSARSYVVQSGDSLRVIGARLGIEPRVLAATNTIGARAILRAGATLQIDDRHILPTELPDATIVINVPQRMLFYRGQDRLVAVPVAVGSAGWQTPVGPFTIIEKETDPTWDVPASIAREAAEKGKPLPLKVGPGPSNPLGRHWMRLSLGTVGIHGTNAPASLFQAVTHGCIRVHPDDIAQLFDLVAIGTAGQVVYEPVLLTEVGGDVYLEIHRDVYRRTTISATDQVRELARAAGLEASIDWTAAAGVIAARDGLARPVTRKP